MNKIYIVARVNQILLALWNCCVSLEIETIPSPALRQNKVHALIRTSGRDIERTSGKDGQPSNSLQDQ